MKVLYLDESGDHSLTKIDPQYPVFVLGGVIVEDDYLESVIQPELERFKLDVFGDANLVLHTADLTRNRGEFVGLVNTPFRKRFYQDLNALMARWEYQVIACLVHKYKHVQHYSASSVDPYALSLGVVVDRFGLDVGDLKCGGGIIAEARNTKLDQQLELAWSNLKIQGTENLRPKELSKRLTELAIRKKGENLAGLQLADLVVSPIGRHVIGKKSHEDFKVIVQKFRRGNRGYEGEGLIVLPK